MKVVIIEDETAAARNLGSMIGAVVPGARVEAVLESVAESVEWLTEHAGEAGPDLLLVDIHLADGESFRIFERVEVACPIVFTTAYDWYALEAFKVNSIDYLLKPIREDDLRRAIDKLHRLSGGEIASRREGIAQVVRQREEQQRVFLVPVRDKIIPLRSERVAFFYTTGERVRATDYDGVSLPMDRSLDKLMKTLSEHDFFRANRQFIVAREAIAEINVWFGSRLSLGLRVKVPERIVISKDRVAEFKRWLTDN
ncbi:MAG: LytTR family DNA-binding domain-containing protein [Alistipes sp.]|jgi:DNA-binding LytR/AlgR family response regulator|nr:LytTR family DNA-binding domain-containing protein [Alistipes sp.]